MIADIDYIRNKFIYFNELCFDGRLPLLPIKIFNSRRSLGMLRFVKRRKLNGTWHYSDFEFRISTKIDRPEDVVIDTILHEMIHYYILYNQMQDSSPHGHLFKSKMYEINRKFGRNITVTHKATSEEQNLDTEHRNHLVCVMDFKDGKRAVMIAARSRLFSLWDSVEKWSAVEKSVWYWSVDPFFNRFPRALTLKAYKVDAEELSRHLANARPLERVGTTIRAVHYRNPG